MTESGFHAEAYEDETTWRPIFRCVRNLVMQDRKADGSIKTSCDGRPDPFSCHARHIRLRLL
jgi:hypothetical protein